MQDRRDWREKLDLSLAQYLTFRACRALLARPAEVYFTSTVPRFGQATICVLGPFSPLASNLARTSN